MCLFSCSTIPCCCRRRPFDVLGHRAAPDLMESRNSRSFSSPMAIAQVYSPRTPPADNAKHIWGCKRQEPSPLTGINLSFLLSVHHHLVGLMAGWAELPALTLYIYGNPWTILFQTPLWKPSGPGEWMTLFFLNNIIFLPTITSVWARPLNARCIFFSTVKTETRLLLSLPIHANFL